MAGCERKQQTEGNVSPKLMRSIGKKAYEATKLRKQDPAFSQWNIDRSNFIIEISQSYMLCNSQEEFESRLEAKLVRVIYDIYKFREGIDSIQTANDSTDSLVLAGEALMYLGWKLENGNDLFDRLREYEENKGTFELRRAFFDDDSFMKFLNGVVQKNNELVESTMADWPKGWGRKPKAWKGIRKPGG